MKSQVKVLSLKKRRNTFWWLPVASRIKTRVCPAASLAHYILAILTFLFGCVPCPALAITSAISCSRCKVWEAFPRSPLLRRFPGFFCISAHLHLIIIC